MKLRLLLFLITFSIPLVSFGEEPGRHQDLIWEPTAKEGQTRVVKMSIASPNAKYAFPEAVRFESYEFLVKWLE